MDCDIEIFDRGGLFLNAASSYDERVFDGHLA